jgi:hypothetical protein
MQRLSAPILGYSNTLRVSRPLKNPVSRIIFFGSANTGRSVDEKRPKSEADFTAVESTDVVVLEDAVKRSRTEDIQTSAVYAALGFWSAWPMRNGALRAVSPRA